MTPWRDIGLVFALITPPALIVGFLTWALLGLTSIGAEPRLVVASQAPLAFVLVLWLLALAFPSEKP